MHFSVLLSASQCFSVLLSASQCFSVLLSASQCFSVLLTQEPQGVTVGTMSECHVEDPNGENEADHYKQKNQISNQSWVPDGFGRLIIHCHFIP